MSQHIRNVGPMRAAPRCGARTRSGTPCQSPRIAGGKRCRMHGGKGSGAPKGNSNAFKHGACTGAMREQVAQVRSVVKEAEALTNPRSAGNGSLMRLAPVAVRHWNKPAMLRDVAARQSRTTHGAPEAVDACVAYAEVLAAAIAGYPRSEVLRPRIKPYSGAIGPIIEGSWRGKHRDAIQSSGYVAHSLEAALWCVARTGNAWDAICDAVNLAEDADTTGAITGQLAGALYGLEEIATIESDRLAQREQITAKARALFAASVEGG